MADKKISQLTTLAQADVAVTADFLPIVDTSATETKKATPQALVQAGATGATLPVALGAVGTPSYTFTGDLNTGMWSPAADTVAVSTGGSERLRVDPSGNVGLGVTPSAWGSGWTAFQLSASGAALSGRGSTSEVYLSSNAHYNGSNWIYKLSATAALYDQDGGRHRWSTAASGTAGNAISFTESMRLESGNLGLGTASPSYRLHVERASAGITGYFFTNDGTNNPRLVIYGDSSGTTLQHTYSSGASSLIFAVGGSIGSGSEVGRVDVNKNWTLGAGTLATTATDGFLYVPTCAGTPTGTPTAKTGYAPIVVDTTNNKMYFYSGGQWRDAGP